MKEKLNRFCRENADTIAAGFFVTASVVVGVGGYAFVKNTKPNPVVNIDQVIKNKRVVSQVVTRRDGSTTTVKTTFIKD